MNYLFPQRGQRERSSTLWLLLWSIFVLWIFIGGAIAAAVHAAKPIGAGSEWEFVVTLANFLPFWLMVFFAPKLLGRNSGTLISYDGSLSAKWFAKGALIWFGLLALSSVIDYFLNPSFYKFAFDPSRLFSILLVVVIFLPIQTSAEEFYFRGLIPQAVSQLTQSKAAIILVSAFLFALPHLGNPEASGEPLWAILAYGSIGASWGFAAAHIGRLEIAMGAHFANNFFGLVVVGYADSALPSLAIWNTPAADLQATAIASLVMFAVWATIVRRLRPTS